MVYSCENTEELKNELNKLTCENERIKNILNELTLIRIQLETRINDLVYDNSKLKKKYETDIKYLTDMIDNMCICKNINYKILKNDLDDTIFKNVNFNNTRYRRR